jgi:hypothetical protein
VFLQGLLSKSFRYYLNAKSFDLSFISILHIYNIRSLSKKKILEISNKMWRPWGSPPRSTDYKDGFIKIARGKLCLPPLWTFTQKSLQKHTIFLTLPAKYFFFTFVFIIIHPKKTVLKINIKNHVFKLIHNCLLYN